VQRRVGSRARRSSGFGAAAPRQEARTGHPSGVASRRAGPSRPCPRQVPMYSLPSRSKVDAAVGQDRSTSSAGTRCWQACVRSWELRPRAQVRSPIIRS
jgi:hypothetical protein